MANSILDFDPSAYFGDEEVAAPCMLKELDICDFKKKKNCCKKFKKGKKPCKSCPKH